MRPDDEPPEPKYRALKLAADRLLAEAAKRPKQRVRNPQTAYESHARYLRLKIRRATSDGERQHYQRKLEEAKEQLRASIVKRTESKSRLRSRR